MTNLLGQQLGNYRLINLLGRGGFAEVYLGEHIHLGTQAAIKVLHTQVNSNEVEKFRKEARTIARLEHPHIVRVLEFGIENDFPYLVMTYAPHGTLRQRHPKGEQLPLNVIIPYVEQVAEALQYIHDQKLIHRDVKPENLLLDSSDNILLSDFGIASVAHTTVSLTTQGQAGTPYYMAPEQIMNKPGSASDQYSLGVIVYEWLCGIRPFQGDILNIFFQHLNTTPPDLRERLSTIPPLVDVAVLKALSKDPKQRFASVKAFANALKQASKAEQATLSIIPATSIAPDFTTQKAEVDTKSGQILPTVQPVPTKDQPSLSSAGATPDNQLQSANNIAHSSSTTIPPSQIVPLPTQPPVSASSFQQVTTLASDSQSRGIHLSKPFLLRLCIPLSIFLICLTLAFYLSSTFHSGLFLPIFFGGLALASLFNNANPGKLRGIYGGFYPFVWLSGLALCFLIGFWPWILIPVALSFIIYFVEKKWHITSSPLQQTQRNRVRNGLWFWIIVAIIILISVGWRLSNGFIYNNSPGFNNNQNNQNPNVGQIYNYTVNGQAIVVINDPNGNVSVTEVPSTSKVSIQPVNGNSFAGNPNSIQQGITQNGNTITASLPDSVDLQITVPEGANLNLTTGSGNINFTGSFAPTGTTQFQTTDGSITVTVPSSPAFHLDASTNTGSITSNFPNVQIQNNASGSGQSVHGVIGGGSHSQLAQVVMRSDTGDINLNQN